MGRDGGWTVKRIVQGARGPELLVEETRVDYIAGRDPVLESAAKHLREAIASDPERD